MAFPLFEDEEPVTIDAYNATTRYGVKSAFAETEGEHILSLINTGQSNTDGAGNALAITDRSSTPIAHQQSRHHPRHPSDRNPTHWSAVCLPCCTGFVRLLLRMNRKTRDHARAKRTSLSRGASNSVIEFWFLAGWSPLSRW